MNISRSYGKAARQVLRKLTKKEMKSQITLQEKASHPEQTIRPWNLCDRREGSERRSSYALEEGTQTSLLRMNHEIP